MNLDPDPSSSDSLDSSSSDSRGKKKKSKKKKSVVSIGKMTRPTHLQAMILIRPMTDIIDVNDANIRNTGKGSDQTMRNFNGKFYDDSI